MKFSSSPTPSGSVTKTKGSRKAGSVYFQSVLRAGRYYLVRNAGHLLQEEAPMKLLEILYSYIPPAVPSYDVYRYTQNLTEDEE